MTESGQFSPDHARSNFELSTSDIPPEVHPQVEAVGPNRDVTGGREEMARSFLTQMRESRDALGQIPGEIEKTPEQIAEILRIHTAVIQLGDELGVNVRDRLPEIRHYHLFGSHEAYVQGAGMVGSEQPTETGGMSDISRGIFCETRDDPVRDRTGFAHEITHFIARGIFYPTVHYDEDGTGHLGGNYTHGFSPQSHALEEWTSDIGMRIILRRAGYEDGDWGESYRPLNMIGDALVAETAAANAESIEAVEKLLVRGKFTGDMDGPRLMTRAIGHDRMQRFMQLHEWSDPATLAEAATQMFLPEVAERIRAMYPDSSSHTE
jgi:hypothetical protein